MGDTVTARKRRATIILPELPCGHYFPDGQRCVARRYEHIHHGGGCEYGSWVRHHAYVVPAHKHAVPPRPPGWIDYGEDGDA